MCKSKMRRPKLPNLSKIRERFMRLRKRLKRKKGKTYFVLTPTDAKELLESGKLNEFDTITVDEEMPNVPLFAPIAREPKKKAKKSKKKKKKVEEPTTPPAPPPVSGISARAETKVGPEQATLIRDKDGKLTIKPVDIPYSGGAGRKRLACVFVILIICSSIVSLVLPLLTTPTGNDEFDELTTYYSVYAWLAYTDTPDEQIPCAMKFYFFENDTWHELVSHNWGQGIILHDFGKAPLGMLCSVRASVEWGTWSPAPAVHSPFTLDSAVGYQLLTYAWVEYTITVELIGSAY